MTATLAQAIQRRRFLGLSAGALAAAAAGCRPGESAAIRRSTLIIASPHGERALVGIDGDDLKNLLYQPLLSRNDNGELEGRLADRWESSPDGRDWTIHLRPGVRWHDGVPVTAHDVKFTLELLSSPDVDEELGRHDIESITVLDDATVRVRFMSWRASQSALDGYEIILPKHRLEGLERKKYAQWDFWTHPVGSGPYRFARYVPRTMLQLDANPDYYRGRPRIAHVVLKFTGAGMTELLAGNVDIVLGANPARSRANVSWRTYSGFYGHQVNGIVWNNVHPILRDPGVRRALTLAINRRELMRLLNLPDVLPLLDGPFTTRLIRRGELPEPLPFDPEQAGALFDVAGWRRAGGLGTRGRNGRVFHLSLLVTREPGLSQAAVYVQEALRQAGVEIEIENLDGGVVMQRFRAGQFAAVLRVVAAGSWRTLLGAHSPLGYRNARVAQLLEQVPLVSSAVEEDELTLEIIRILRAEVPVTVLFPRVSTTLASPRIRGLSSPWRVNPIWSIEDLSLDDGR